MAYENRDYTHLSEEEKQKIELIAQAIRNKAYGIDVRESIALAIEWVNREYKTTIANNKLTLREFENAKSKVSNLELDMDEFIKRYSEQVAGNTSLEETIDARVDAAGVSHTTLKDRLDKDQQEVTTQLAQTEHQQFKNSPVSHKSQRPLIVWIDDDAHKGVYTKIAPLLREYNIRMTSALITGAEIGLPVENVPDRVNGTSIMTYEQMKELHDEGIVEFVSHTHTHDANNRLTQMTEASLRFELEESQRVLKSLGFNHRHLVYPFGTENSFVQRIASEYFESAVHISGGYVGLNMNQYKINRQSMDSTDFDAIKAEMDKAIETKTGLILMSHIDQYGGLDLSKARQVIEYAQNNGMEFVKLSEFVQEKGNLLQFGDNKITANGDVFGGKIGTVQRRQDITHDSDLYQFEENKVTITRVTPSNATNYGLPTSFTLLTYRDEQIGYSFQKAIFSDGRPSRRRVWNTLNDKWEPFVVELQQKRKTVYTVNETIPARSSIFVDIQNADLKQTQTHVAQFIDVVSQNILWNCFAFDDGRVRINIYNNGDTQANLSNKRIEIKSFEGL